MADADLADEPMTTNLTVPAATRRRVLIEADADKRKYKAELLVLIDEALDARDRKRSR